MCSCFQCAEKIILIFIKRLNVKLRVNDSLKICLCFSLLTMSRSRWAHTVLCFHASNTAIILLLWVRLSKRINIKRCSYQHISVQEKNDSLVTDKRRHKKWNYRRNSKNVWEQAQIKITAQPVWVGILSCFLSFDMPHSISV